MRLLPSALAAALAGAALLAPPAAAAPATCVASGVNGGTCTYQSSGGLGRFTCAAAECFLYVDGYYAEYLTFGATTTFWTSYADVVRVYAYDGVATAGDNRRV